MNSGDWVENLTSLEYENGAWKIYKYQESDFINYKKFNDRNIPELRVVTDEINMYITSLGNHLNEEDAVVMTNKKKQYF